MSSTRVNGHIESKGSELCLYCGLCCRGVIFNRAALEPSEIKPAKDYGLRYFKANKGEYAFRLPCCLYQNDKCSIYLNRLNACKRYRCSLLKRLINGDIDLEESKLIVVVKFLDMQCRNPMVCRDPSSLLKDIESFYIILHRYIEKRAN